MRSLALLLACGLLLGASPPDFDHMIREMGSAGRPGLDHDITRLKNAGTPRAVMAKIARLLVEGEKSARQNAAYVLAAIPDPSVGAALLLGVRDEDEVVRERCCTALGGLRLHESLRPLSAATLDTSPVVRREAAKALGHLGDRSASAKVAALLDDATPETRLAAILALGELHDKSVEAKLLPLLKDSSETVRLAAAKSLCAIGSTEGRRTIETLLKSADASERRQGLRLVEDVKLPWVAAALFEALHDKDLDACIAAARGLARQGDGRGIEWLVLSSARVDPSVQVRIETALEELRLSPEDRKKILARKPSAGLPLPPVETAK